MRNGDKTHCIHGHEFTPENTYRTRKPSGGFARQCRTCSRDRNKARLQRLATRNEFPMVTQDQIESIAAQEWDRIELWMATDDRVLTSERYAIDQVTEDAIHLVYSPSKRMIPEPIKPVRLKDIEQVIYWVDGERKVAA